MEQYGILVYNYHLDGDYDLLYKRSIYSIILILYMILSLIQLFFLYLSQFWNGTRSHQLYGQWSVLKPQSPRSRPNSLQSPGFRPQQKKISRSRHQKIPTQRHHPPLQVQQVHHYRLLLHSRCLVPLQKAPERRQKDHQPGDHPEVLQNFEPDSQC